MSDDIQLPRWQTPADYAGDQFHDYFVFLGQHRDSDAVSRPNFTCGLKAIGGETETVIVARASHWAVGWVEQILIHEADTEALEKASEIIENLKDYPVVDDEHYSELESDEAAKYWSDMSTRDRIEACQSAGISLFSARKKHLFDLEDERGTLREYLTMN